MLLVSVVSKYVLSLNQQLWIKFSFIKFFFKLLLCAAVELLCIIWFLLLFFKLIRISDTLQVNVT